MEKKVREMVGEGRKREMMAEYRKRIYDPKYVANLPIEEQAKYSRHDPITKEYNHLQAVRSSSATEIGDLARNALSDPACFNHYCGLLEEIRIAHDILDNCITPT